MQEASAVLSTTEYSAFPQYVQKLPEVRFPHLFSCLAPSQVLDMSPKRIYEKLFVVKKTPTTQKQKPHNLNLTVKDLRDAGPLKTMKTELKFHRKYFEWLWPWPRFAVLQMRTQ